MLMRGRGASFDRTQSPQIAITATAMVPIAASHAGKSSVALIA